MANFLGDGSTPRITDGSLVVLQKILVATNASGGGGAASVQIVTYTSGTPANPANTAQPAISYDPNGVLPMLGWNILSHSWV